MPPDASLVARLRAAGCVFAEDEAALLTEASEGHEDAEAELEALATAGWRGAARAGAGLGGVRGPAHAAGAGSVRAAPTHRAARRGGGRFAAEIADEGRTPWCSTCAAVSARSAPPSAACRRADRSRRGRHRPGRGAGRATQPRPLGAGVVEGRPLRSVCPHDLLGRVDVLAVNAPTCPRGDPMMPAEARDHGGRGGARRWG